MCTGRLKALSALGCLWLTLLQTEAARADSSSIFVRVRVKEAISYQGFTYSGHHWLEGTVKRLDADTIVLRMRKGGGDLAVPTAWVTECQTRGAPDKPWRDVPLPLRNISDLQEAAKAAERPTARQQSARRFSFTALGIGQVQLPKNAHPTFSDSPLPNGETIETLLVSFGATTPFGFGWGVRWVRYSVTKGLRNVQSDVTLTHKYSVSSPAAYLSYDTILGSTDLSPRVGIHGGATVSFVDFELRTTSPGEIKMGDLVFPTTDTEKTERSSVKIGPYVGAEILIPLGSSRLSLYGVVEKMWFQDRYDEYGSTDVQLGPLVIGGGLAFVQY